MATHSIHKVALTSEINKQSLYDLRKTYSTPQDSQQKSRTSLIEYNHLKMQLAELKSKQVHLYDVFKQIKLIKQTKLNKYRILYQYDQESSLQKVMKKIQNKVNNKVNEKQTLVTNPSPQKCNYEIKCSKIIYGTSCCLLQQNKSDNNENTVIQANV